MALESVITCALGDLGNSLNFIRRQSFRFAGPMLSQLPNLAVMKNGPKNPLTSIAKAMMGAIAFAQGVIAFYLIGGPPQFSLTALYALVVIPPLASFISAKKISHTNICSKILWLTIVVAEILVSISLYIWAAEGGWSALMWIGAISVWGAFALMHVLFVILDRCMGYYNKTLW